MPLAARWPLPACDLVVSFSHCVAKAAVPPPGVPHVCYCFTPMRYAWHMREAYFGRLRPAAGLADRPGARPAAALGPGHRRPRDALRRHQPHGPQAASASATAATAPSSIRRSTPTSTRPPPVPREDYYLVVSAFAPYKRLDLAIDACRQLGRKLVVIGTGQDERRLRSLAGPETTFLGWQSDEAIRDHLRRCRALLFPGEEDFGIVPVEAQACGTPVIAFGRGGAAETVVPPVGRPTDGRAVRRADGRRPGRGDGPVRAARRDFDPRAARRQALRFHPPRFDAEFDRVPGDARLRRHDAAAA